MCVCVRREGWREGIKDAMVNRYRRAMTHLPVCSGEVNATINHPPTTVFLLHVHTHTSYSLQRILKYVHTQNIHVHTQTDTHAHEHTPVQYHLDCPGWTAGVVVCTQI